MTLAEQTPLGKNETGMLRFGVMVNGDRLQAWQIRALEGLIESGLAELDLVIGKDEKSSRLRSLFSHFGHGFLFWCYCRFYADKRSTAYRMLNAESVLSGAERIICKPVATEGETISLAVADVERIRDRQLDFIIRFGFGKLRGGILKSARFGVWSYHHADERVIRGGPSGFWEIMLGHAATGGIVERLTETLDAGQVLYRAQYKTIAHSYRKNRELIYLQSADWLAHVARRIVLADGRLPDETDDAGPGPIYRHPTTLEFLLFGAKLVRNLVRHTVRTFFVLEIWNIGHVRADIRTVIAEKKLPPVAWWPERNRRRFIADPFLVHSASGTQCLFEDCDALGKGRIGVVDLPPPPGAVAPAILAAAPYHLSYPFILTMGDRVYCLPETSEAGGLPLHELRDGELIFETDILPDQRPVDATVLRHDGRFWIFCGLADDLPEHKLHIFHAENLEGPYQAHADNPVKIDITGARPAGPFLEVGDALYRPAQNCAASYGASLTLFRVEELNPSRYHETFYCSFLPDPEGKYRNGLHTLCHLDGSIAIDGKRNVFSLLQTRRALDYLRRRGQPAEASIRSPDPAETAQYGAPQ